MACHPTVDTLNADKPPQYLHTYCVLRLHWGLINLPNAAAICSWQGCFLWPPPQSPTLLVSIVICQCREWSYNRDRERQRGGEGTVTGGGLRCVWGFPYGVVSLSVCPKMWLLQLDARRSPVAVPLPIVWWLWSIDQPQLLQLPFLVSLHPSTLPAAHQFALATYLTFIE